jgi:predicted dehydrogenase
MTRVGIAGYGMAGRLLHAAPIAQVGMTVAAVATRNASRAGQVEREHPEARIVPDLEALLEVGDLDLVVLATPTGDHAAQSLAVIAAGLPLVVDKPLGVNAAETREVVSAASAAGVPLTIFQNRRYDAEHATLRQVVRGRRVGDPYRLELRWERWRPVPKDRWRETMPPQRGGGLLLDLHSHLVDAAVDLFGPVEAVYAELAAHTTVAEDDAFLACRHTSGTISHLGAMSVAGAPGPRVRLLGTRGAYVMGDFEGELNVFPDTADADAAHCGWVYAGESREPVERAASEQADFYRAVEAALAEDDPRKVQAAMPVDPRDAIHVMAVLDAARVSAARATVETVTPAGGDGSTAR